MDKTETGSMGRRRSPSFPFISLGEAVGRARTLLEVERRNAAEPAKVVRHWGYSPHSSGGHQTIAALRAFGLLEGGGTVRLTDIAVHILGEPEGSPERNDLLRRAALAPPVHERLWRQYRQDLPPDGALASYLTVELGFNPGTIDGFIRCYRQTLADANLLEQAPAPTLPPSDLTLRFPLLNDNWGELRVLRRIAPGEAGQIRTLFEIWLEKIVERS
jgi:hypothetical protein